jgi:type I restriction modification DNA specificity protein
VNTVTISEVFFIEYGNKFNFNAAVEDDCGINFVTRSRNNLGIGGKVARIDDAKPYPPGLITVSLGGTYLLSAFVQPSEFYTAQNIKVLRPKETMSFGEKAYYCACISANRFKYSSHGREANRSFHTLLIPDRASIPSWARTSKPGKAAMGLTAADLSPKPAKFSSAEVPLIELFEPHTGINPSSLPTEETKLDETYIPVIRPSKTQASSFVEFVSARDVDPDLIFPKGTLYVSTNGQGSHTYAYVSAFEFVPNTDVIVLKDRAGRMGIFEKLFYATAITHNRRLFSYGRKPKGLRLEQLLVPATPPPYVFGPGPISRISAESWSYS